MCEIGYTRYACAYPIQTTIFKISQTIKTYLGLLDPTLPNLFSTTQHLAKMSGLEVQETAEYYKWQIIVE